MPRFLVDAFIFFDMLVATLVRVETAGCAPKVTFIAVDGSAQFHSVLVQLGVVVVVAAADGVGGGDIFRVTIRNFSYWLFFFQFRYFLMHDHCRFFC